MHILDVLLILGGLAALPLATLVCHRVVLHFFLLLLLEIGADDAVEYLGHWHGHRGRRMISRVNVSHFILRIIVA